MAARNLVYYRKGLLLAGKNYTVKTFNKDN
jgi:hypothetical protein